MHDPRVQSTSIYLGEGPTNCPECGTKLLRVCAVCASRKKQRRATDERLPAKMADNEDKSDWRKLHDHEHERVKQAISDHGIQDVALVAGLRVETVRNAIKKLPMGPVTRTALLKAVQSYKRVKFYGP